MNDSLKIFAAAAGLAALTWWSYRRGVDQMVERERNPVLFKVNISLNILLVLMAVAGGVLSLIYH